MRRFLTSIVIGLLLIQVCAPTVMRSEDCCKIEKRAMSCCCNEGSASLDHSKICAQHEIVFERNSEQRESAASVNFIVANINASTDPMRSYLPMKVAAQERRANLPPLILRI